jgi:fatty-acyl-CoA synthase
MLTGNVVEEVEVRTKTGRPVPLVDIRIVDPEMKNVPHDGKSAGEIVVRAPWLTQGYHEHPEASEFFGKEGICIRTTSRI